MTLSIRLFGQPELRFDTQLLSFDAPPKTLPLLAYCLLHRDQALDRQALAFLFWPDSSEEDARANLRRHLYQLGRVLQQAPSSEPWLLTNKQTLQWNPSTDYWLDVAEFERLSADPQSHEQAAACYRGSLLEGYYDNWIIFEQERQRRLYFDLLFQLVTRYRQAGSPWKALEFAHQVLALDPFHEEMVRQIMAIRTESGNRAGAIQEYELFKQRLQQEMDVPPMPETQALYESILSGSRLLDEKRPQPALKTPTLEPPSRPFSTAVLPFVGREAEMHQLLDWWDPVGRGHGAFGLIGGEAGVGKTRLLQEFAIQVEQQGGLRLVGYTQPNERRPYQALLEALRCALPELASQETSSSPLAALLPLLPELKKLLQLPPLAQLEPQHEQSRLFNTLAWSLEKLAAEHPLLLILEDLHWATETDFTLLEFLAHRVASQPIFILGAYRDEETHRTHPLHQLRRKLASDLPLRHLFLQRLPNHSVKQLLEQLEKDPTFKQSGLPTPDLLHTESEGSPLFIELLLRRWQDSQGMDLGGLSQTIQSLVASRLTSLPPETQAFLEVAAVFGQVFDADVIREVGGWDEAYTTRSLNNLLDFKIIRDAAPNSKFDYQFVHHLIQSSIYSALPASRRKRRHLRVAQILEELYPERLDLLAHDLSFHYEMSGEGLRAVPFYIQVARQNLLLYADTEALIALDRALRLGETAPLSQQIQICLLRAEIYDRRGLRDPQRANLDRLEQLCAIYNDPDTTCQMLKWQVLYYRALADREAEQRFIERLKLQSLSSPPAWQSEALLMEGVSKLLNNLESEGSELIQTALTAFQEQKNIRGQINCCLYLSEMHIRFRQIEESEKWVQIALGLLDKQHITTELLRMFWNISANYLILRDFEKCQYYARQLLKASEQAFSVFWQATAHRLLGQLYRKAFNIQEARCHLETAQAFYVQIQHISGQALIKESLGLLAISVGRLDEGQHHFSRSLEISEKLKKLGSQTSQAINLASTCYLAGQYQDEKTFALKALELARQFSNRFLEGHAHQYLGEAERALGNLAQALEHSQTAFGIFTELNQFMEAFAVRADLALVYLKMGQITEALAQVQGLLDEYHQVHGKEDNLQRYLWYAAWVLQSAGQTEQAQQSLQQAWEEMQRSLALIPDEDSRRTYRQLIYNRQLLAAHDQKLWTSIK
jgi:predicted ATPase/DNA-binding SARP family transcriptional activator